MRKVSKATRHAGAVHQRRHLVESLESRTFLNAADLDATFGTGGIATTQFNGYGHSAAQAVAVQADGKVVAAGYSAVSGGVTQVAVARYNTNGSLDTTFGAGGTMQFAVGRFAEARAIAIQSDGRIVIAGFANPNFTISQFLVARVNTNGTLDTTFNTTGYENFSVGPADDTATCLAIQSNGKIVVGGQDSSFRGYSQFAMARVNVNGGLDSTFGIGGLVLTKVNNNTSEVTTCNAIAIDSAGHIDAAGAIGIDNFSSSQLGYIQYTSSGQMNFIAQEPISGNNNDVGTGIVIQSTGNVVVSGNANGSFAAARFTSSGHIDQTFANFGTFYYTANSGTCRSTNLMSNGDIVLAGSGFVGNTSSMILRLTPAGALDTTFNTTGTLFFGTHFPVYASAVRSTGAIVVAGNITPPGSMTLQQFTTTGAADTTFGSGAPIGTDFIDPVQTTGRSAALQTDGKVLVAANYNQSQTTNRFEQSALTRYTVNGTVDTSFGTNGSVMITAGSQCDIIAVVIQPNGDSVVAGSVHDATQTSEYTMIERFLPTGALDTTFGVGGQRLLNSAAGYATFNAAYGLTMQPDGTLYILSITGSDSGATITRLTPSGQFDTTYGAAGTGIVTTTTPWTTEALDASGRLLVADGQLLARYTANGTLDTTFQVPSISTNASAGTIIPQPDGKVVISSTTSPGNLERYTSAGAVDVTFGSAGLATTPQTNVSLGVGTLLPNGDLFAGGLQSNFSTGISSAVVNAFNSYGMPITTFGAGGAGVYAGLSANNALVVRSNGRVLMIGQTPDGKEAAAQILGSPQNVLQAAPGSETINLSRSADGLSINWTLGAASGSALVNDPAGLTINGDSATDTINVAGNTALPAILHLNGKFTLNGLTGTDPLAGNALDINGGALFITYAGPTADPMTNIRADIKKGYGFFGQWDQIPTVKTGVIGSAAAEGNPGHAIGYADSADGMVPLPANTLELKYTLYGDTGLTGSVTFTDFMRMTQHYTLTNTVPWSQGDFNYDGNVDFLDFNLLKPNFGQTLPAPMPAVAPASTLPSAPATVAPINPIPVVKVTPDAPTIPGQKKKHPEKSTRKHR